MASGESRVLPPRALLSNGLKRQISNSGVPAAVAPVSSSPTTSFGDDEGPAARDFPAPADPTTAGKPRDALFCTRVQDFLLFCLGSDPTAGDTSHPPADPHAALNSPFRLPSNGGLQVGSAYFTDGLQGFVDANLRSAVEQLREEIASQVRVCGTRVPSEFYGHIRMEKRGSAALQLAPVPPAESAIVSESDARSTTHPLDLGLCKLQLAPRTAGVFQHYPTSDARAPQMSNYVCAVHGSLTSTEQGAAHHHAHFFGAVLVEKFTKGGGAILRGSRGVLAGVKEFLDSSPSTAGATLYFQRLTRLNPMSMQPLFLMQRMVAPESELQRRFADKGVPCLLRDLLFGPGPLDGGADRTGFFARKNEFLQNWEAESKRLGPMDARANGKIQFQDFNEMQREALALEACVGGADGQSPGVVLIQGPPGTGKSHLIANGILPAAAVALERKENVLVLCNSNAAIDSIFEKLLDSADMVPPSASSALLKNLSFRVGYKTLVSNRVVQSGCYCEKMEHCTPIIARGEKRVLFTTFYGACKEAEQDQAGGLNPDGQKPFSKTWDTIVLDEAGQVEESRVFQLLSLIPSVKKLILVGDHKQLQPYVSEGVRAQGYGRSMLERLIEGGEKGAGAGSSPSSRGGDARSLTSFSEWPYVMLRAQHRMPPPVRQVVSKLFYSSKLQDGQNVAAGKVERTGLEVVCHSGQAPCMLPSILAFDLRFGETEWSFQDRSLENRTEAQVTEQIYHWLIKFAQKPGAENASSNAHLTENDVCILSPYNKHKDRLRMTIAGIPERQLASFDKKAVMAMDKNGGTTAKLTGTDRLAVMCRNMDTVDKFQGSEREVVVINTVVQPKGSGGKVGVFSRAGDPHFVNVACSRSRRLLVLVGSLEELRRADPLVWGALMDEVDGMCAAGGNVGGNGAALAAAKFLCTTTQDVDAALAACARGEFASGGGGAEGGTVDAKRQKVR